MSNRPATGKVFCIAIGLLAICSTGSGQVVLGDFNGDGHAGTPSDRYLLSLSLTNPSLYAIFHSSIDLVLVGDFTNDGEFTNADLKPIIACYSSGLCVRQGVGDMNGDGVITNADISPFVLALVDPEGYETQYPDLYRNGRGDHTYDGLLTNADITPFVTLNLIGGSALPEPSALALVIGLFTGSTWARPRRARCLASPAASSAIL